MYQSDKKHFYLHQVGMKTIYFLNNIVDGNLPVDLCFLKFACGEAGSHMGLF